MQGDADRPAARARASRPPSWPGAWSSACARTPASSGREREFEGIEDLIERGTGADRQLAEWRANRDMVALVRSDRRGDRGRRCAGGVAG